MNWWNRPCLSIKDMVLYGGGASLGYTFSNTIIRAIVHAYHWLVS
jgi:hypothetical protein